MNKIKQWKQIVNAQKNQKQNQNSRKKLRNYFVKFWKNRWKIYQTKSFQNLISARTKNIDKKMIQLHQNFVKAKSALTTQIRIENVKLANFLYNRKISKINLSTCFCDYQRQTMKHIIVSCSLHDRTEIENERKTIDYRFFINTAAELKKFIRWIMKLKILFQFTLIHEHLYFKSNSDH